jgi:hypothetical protein
MAARAADNAIELPAADQARVASRSMDKLADKFRGLSDYFDLNRGSVK